SKSPATPGIDRQTIATFWRASVLHKRLLAMSLLFPVGVLCISTLVPLYVGRILATLGRPGTQPSHYLPYFVGSAVIGVICNRYGFIAMLHLQAKVMRELHMRAFTALLNRSVGFHGNNVGGKLVSDTIDYVNAYGGIANTVYTSILPLLVTLLS